MRRFLKRFVLIVSAASASTLLVMCGPTGMDMMGDAMVDAGNLLRDGASDTGSDAMAQAGCATNCTGGGVLRVMTADTDPAQLETEEVVLSATTPASGFEVVQGPFVLTDVGLARAWGAVGSPINLSITTDPDCESPFIDEQQLLEFDSSDPYASRMFTGMHLLIPGGTRLCALTSSPSVLTYAGFRPYD